MFKYIDLRVYSLVKVDKSEIWKVGIMVAMRKIKRIVGSTPTLFTNFFTLFTNKNQAICMETKKINTSEVASLLYREMYDMAHDLDEWENSDNLVVYLTHGDFTYEVTFDASIKTEKSTEYDQSDRAYTLTSTEVTGLYVTDFVIYNEDYEEEVTDDEIIEEIIKLIEK